MQDLLIINGTMILFDIEPSFVEGYISVDKGIITEIGSGLPAHRDYKEVIDAQGMYVLPGLADCHTHLMEYGTGEIHNTQGSAQKMAGIANLLEALKTGITAVGEHHLGHPVLKQRNKEYLELVAGLPLDVKLAFGCCFIGTDPLTLVSSSQPGQVINQDQLTHGVISQMAQHSQFPGESIFLNATVANLPLDLAPRAGEITFTKGELKKIVDIFHSHAKQIGAHIEGDEAALMFIGAGGDVIHHGHGISLEVAKLMAQKAIPLIITPHGGTSSRPTSPQEAYSFYQEGVTIAFATDAYLPVHPEATWLNLPPGYLVGPRDFLKICRPYLQYFLEQGVPREEALKLLTLNGHRILGTRAGSLQLGNQGDIIISGKLPGIETGDPEDLKYIIKNGEVVIQR